MNTDSKKTEKRSDIQVVMHRLLTELDFTKCEDSKYRRCMVQDFMNVKVDEYGYMWISAELEHKTVEIQITMIKFEDRNKFKDWLLFTYGVEYFGSKQETKQCNIADVVKSFTAEEVGDMLANKFTTIEEAIAFFDSKK